MLKSLYIKDFALIDSITVEFGKGLNIITGETGAGKSILLSALGLLLGDRASSESIRNGAAKAIVEGIFEVSGNKKIKQICTDNEIEVDSELIVRRELSLKGSGRCFLNDTPVSLTALKDAGDSLVDLHGQHEHQSLLRSELHIDILDDFCGLDEKLSSFEDSFRALLALKKKIKDLQDNEREIKRNREIYEYQLKEIDAAAPLEGEDKELEDETRLQEHAEKLLDLAGAAYDRLYENTGSVLDQMGKVKEDIKALAEIDQSLVPAAEEIVSVIANIKEISYQLRDYKNKIDLDPARLNELRSRLGVLQALKKKFTLPLDGILRLREKLAEELSLSANFEDAIADMKADVKNARVSIGAQALQMSEIRKNGAKIIEKEILVTLNELGIANAAFEVHFDAGELTNPDDGVEVNGKSVDSTKKGFDRVVFLISTNAGEPLKPLAKVASGGEVSRIMLALKTILAKNDKLPLLVFDEIDTGVSGRVAQKVGAALLQLGTFHQIISITHLPQIAGMADTHFVVEKDSIEGRSYSRIRKLTEEEHIREVAKLLSGELITENNLNSAKDLIDSKSALLQDRSAARHL